MSTQLKPKSYFFFFYPENKDYNIQGTKLHKCSSKFPKQLRKKIIKNAIYFPCTENPHIRSLKVQVTHEIHYTDMGFSATKRNMQKNAKEEGTKRK